MLLLWGIGIAYNCPNPYDNKYRMLDGRHRIMRHLFNGKTESEFYVFDFNEIKQFMIDWERIQIRID